MTELERLEKNVEDAKAAADSYDYDDDATTDASNAAAVAHYAWDEARWKLNEYLKEQAK